MNVLSVLKSLIVFAVLVAMPGVLVAAHSPCCNLGDANGDGEVTAADLTEMRKHELGLTCLPWQEQCQADVDGDGVLTAADLQIVQDFLLGLRDTFPRCGDLDGDGVLAWNSFEGDVNEFTSCAIKNRNCPNADADNDGDYDQDDVALFRQLAGGLIHDFPGCACGEGACG